MIKFYNNSSINDKPLLAIIKAGMKQLDLKGDIIFLIKNGRIGGGYYWRGNLFRDRRFNNRYQWVSANLGKIEINPHLGRDFIQSATYMYEAILHELKHARDIKVDRMVCDSHKVQYRKRNHEISARFFAKYTAKYDDELLLNLAIEIERIVNTKYKYGIP